MTQQELPKKKVNFIAFLSFSGWVVEWVVVHDGYMGFCYKVKFVLEIKNFEKF